MIEANKSMYWHSMKSGRGRLCEVAPLEYHYNLYKFVGVHRNSTTVSNISRYGIVKPKSGIEIVRKYQNEMA
jgi:hypothetical protein